MFAMSLTNEKIAEINAESSSETRKPKNIVNKRITENGKIQYLIKWTNLSNAYNTWEPEENLNCEHLIIDFEKKSKLKTKKKSTRGCKRSKAKSTDASGLCSPTKKATSNNKKNRTVKKKNKNNGLESDKIVEATDSSNEIMFYLKRQKNELSLAQSSSSMFKQVFISYHEDYVLWRITENENSV